METRPLDYVGPTTPKQAGLAPKRRLWLVALALLAALGGLVVIVTQPEPHGGEARQSVAEADLGALANAVRMFEMDTGRLPTNSEGLSPLRVAPADVQADW